MKWLASFYPHSNDPVSGHEKPEGAASKTMKPDDSESLPILKIRFFTSYKRCNLACEYCVTTERNDAPLETRSQRQPSIGSRIFRTLVNPRRALATAAAIVRNPTALLAAKAPAVWDEKSYGSIIRHMAELPYRLDVRIGVGGELFTSKALIAGARELSHSGNVIAINLISNLSFSYQQYLKMFQGFEIAKVALVASFHPTQVKDANRWLETALRMKEMVDLAVVVVGWPPVLAQLPEIKASFEAQGISVFTQAFQGWFAGRKYPEAYSKEELSILEEIFYSRHDYEHMVQLKRPGSCFAGSDYVLIDINGDVFRCGGTSEPLGNIFDGFALLAGPRSCPSRACWCDTENLNTKAFREHYRMTGLNQHKYLPSDRIEPR